VEGPHPLTPSYRQNQNESGLVIRMDDKAALLLKSRLKSRRASYRFSCNRSS